MGIFAVFLLRPASSFLWAHLPLLAPTMVFPQRFLGLVMFCGSVLGGLYMYHIHSRHKWTAAIIAMGCIVLVNFPYLHLNKNREQDIARLNAPRLTTTDVWGEFSPKWIPSDFQQKGLLYGQQPMLTVLPPGPSAPLCTQTSRSVTCSIATSGPATVRFRQFYFPGWIAYADAKKIPVTMDTDGTIVLSLTKPTQIIQIEFTQTPLRKFSSILSVLFTGLYIFLFTKTIYTRFMKRDIMWIVNIFLLASVILYGYYGFFSPGGMNYVYRNWDGPGYLVVAKTLYNVDLINKINPFPFWQLPIMRFSFPATPRHQVIFVYRVQRIHDFCKPIICTPVFNCIIFSGQTG